MRWSSWYSHVISVISLCLLSVVSLIGLTAPHWICCWRCDVSHFCVLCNACEGLHLSLALPLCALSQIIWTWSWWAQNYIQVWWECCATQPFSDRPSILHIFTFVSQRLLPLRGNNTWWVPGVETKNWVRTANIVTSIVWIELIATLKANVDSTSLCAIHWLLVMQDSSANMDNVKDYS